VPAYEFRCKDCHRTFTLKYATYAERDAAAPQCPHCGSADLSNLIHRVGVLTSQDSRMERLSDPSRLSGIDEDDPRSMGRLMREMSAESGEELGPEFDDVVQRLESGEDPESIENSMPELGGGDEGGMDDAF
jgi:putative FmdB family regulatory protein